MGCMHVKVLPDGWTVKTRDGKRPLTMRTRSPLRMASRDSYDIDGEVL